MRPDESRARTFIVRMRLEPRLTPGATGEWHGEVERIPDGARRFFRGVDEAARSLHALLDESAV